MLAGDLKIMNTNTYMDTIKNLTKSYYSISEVASMFDVKSSLIRYYETEFTFFKPHKRNGERRFTPKNIEDFGMIHNLVKERGFTLDGAANEIKNMRAQKKQKHLMLRKLQSLRTKLVKMKEEI